MKIITHSRSLDRIKAVLKKDFGIKIPSKGVTLEYHSEKSETLKWEINTKSKDIDKHIYSEYGIGHLLRYGLEAIKEDDGIKLVPAGIIDDDIDDSEFITKNSENKNET